MRSIMKKYGLPAIMALAVMGLFAQCEKDDPLPQAIFTVNQFGYSQFNRNALRTQLNNLPKEALSAEEEAGLLFMREEEKLAFDIYSRFYNLWSNQVFNNISQSEATHTEAVLLLLEKYQLPDPVGNNGVGVFTNATLQQLYNDLLSQGQSGEIAALQAGAAVEEIDILDLEQQLLNIVDNQDIRLVYTNLQKGSRNHLRAFVRNLANRGVTYEPQYLSREMYDDIIAGDLESGGN